MAVMPSRGPRAKFACSECGYKKPLLESSLKLVQVAELAYALVLGANTL